MRRQSLILLLCFAGCRTAPVVRPVADARPVQIATLPLGFPGDSGRCVVARAGRRYPRQPARDTPVQISAPLRTGGAPGPLAAEGEHLHETQLSPTGELIAVVTLGPGGARLRVADAATGRTRFSVDSIWASSSWALRFSPDGGLLAAALADGSVRLISTATGRVRVLRHDQFRPAVLPEIIGGDAAGAWREVSAVEFSPEGRSLVSMGADGNVVLWELPGGRPRWVRSLQGAGRAPPLRAQAGFAPDGRVLAQGNGPLLLLSPRDGHLLGELATPIGAAPILTDTGAAAANSFIVDFAASPDGQVLVAHGRTVGPGTAWGDATDWLTVWWWGACPDLAGTVLTRASLGLIRVSPDHRWVAARSNGGIHVWEIASGRERFRIPAAVLPGSSVNSFAFDPEGDRILTFQEGTPSVLTWVLRDPAPPR